MPRMLVSDRIVTVFGGSGFVGRHVIRALAEAGWRVRNAVRRPDLATHLQPLGAVGQIASVQANIRYPESIARAIEGADAVVNLVGILHETGKQSFMGVHADGARAIAEAAKAAGVSNLVQISAIGASADSASEYARSKAAGERAVIEAFAGAVILRPSVVFGPEDRFFNKFAEMARYMPFLPLVGGGETRFQPVFVGDLADAVVRGVNGELRGDTVYELGGPEVKTFRELMAYVLEVTGRKRFLAPIPFPIARMQAGILEKLPKPMLTTDQVALLQSDNVVSQAAQSDGRTLEGIGIRATALETVVPAYLYRYRKAGQFSNIHAG